MSQEKIRAGSRGPRCGTREISKRVVMLSRVVERQNTIARLAAVAPAFYARKQPFDARAIAAHQIVAARFHFVDPVATGFS